MANMKRNEALRVEKVTKVTRESPSQNHDSITIRDSIEMSSHDMDVLIDNEKLAHNTKKRKWQQLDACFQWQKICEYMASSGHPNKDKILHEVKRALQKGNPHLNVTYDATTQRIVDIQLPSSRPKFTKTIIV